MPSKKEFGILGEYSTFVEHCFQVVEYGTLQRRRTTHELYLETGKGIFERPGGMLPRSKTGKYHSGYPVKENER